MGVVSRIASTELHLQSKAIFRPHLNASRDLRLGRIFACRVVEDSINLAAAYLAKPVHIYTISSDGTMEKLENEQLDHIAQTCELWREFERDAVGKLIAPKGEEEYEPEVPKPE